ncbi:amidohydrolase/deacetylase family metallohydrolase [Enterococcus mundtii]|uniref:amidohydrolase/deacetylase family metallohydrolase n=1 Tax=Enterococcus mundtii TaxID=53346 RepID=UPI0018998FE3|nr:amidohydrolase/deacetylase family metallohydrolase [Enterococcus mundtii]MBO1084911.1 amidohydrolase/deacetylase family metallohydrolase [Enterococcus mundtii]MDV7743833.1 amidohydrolase/deacetylase family metallohydrolase [Enterococcus mundtii]
MFDLIIRNGKELGKDPVDIGVKNGKIALISKHIEESGKKELVLSDEQYLSAGWIDDHVHCFEEMTLYYDYPDEIGVDKGVTTVIDAGTTGAENIHTFYEHAKQAKTNVFALLNISKWGIVEQDELADLSKIQTDLVHQKLTELPDFIVGLKARMSKTVVGKNGITPLKLAKEIQKQNAGLPLMVHIGSAPPRLDEILAHMGKNDVMTHCFNGKPNGIIDPATNEIKSFVKKAIADGVVFDIGHGTDSFNFDVAETALHAGIKADSISTDIYIRNRKNGPVYDLATTMEKLYVVGYSWQEILEKVTSAPARQFNLATKGNIKEGFDADFTIYKFHDQEKQLTDSNGNTRTTTQQIIPVSVVIGGVSYDCES